MKYRLALVNGADGDPADTHLLDLDAVIAIHANGGMMANGHFRQLHAERSP